MSEEKKGFWSRLVSGLSKTRDNIVSGIDAVFNGFSNIDDDFYEEIEEILIMGDIGVNATEAIIENLKKKVKENHIKDPAECKELLINSIKEQMDVGETAYRFENEKSVVLVIGVNGVGKTTSVGKLAGKLKDQGKKVVLAAADTFRAAAGTQLQEWANRAGVEMIGGQEGADPGAIVYDAVAAAKARNADVLLCDTAGRLHNKKNLMDELAKINRIIDNKAGDCSREVLLVLDATTGQNAVNQAKLFSETAPITGIVLTKLDGTAKGGIVISIKNELGIPVKLIGVGEKIDDLQPFDSNMFVDALFAADTSQPEDEEEGSAEELAEDTAEEEVPVYDEETDGVADEEYEAETADVEETPEEEISVPVEGPEPETVPETEDVAETDEAAEEEATEETEEEHEDESDSDEETETQPQEEVKPKKKGFFSRLFGGKDK